MKYKYRNKGTRNWQICDKKWYEYCKLNPEFYEVEVSDEKESTL